MTDAEYREKQARGLAARALLESPSFQAAFDAVRTELVREWEQSSPTAPSVREQKYAEVRGLLSLKARLTGWVDDATFSAVTLEKQRR